LQRVLIIEDEPDMGGFIVMTLRAEGYSVAVGANGKQGLDRLAEQRPDVILLDLSMPVMNGWEFLAVCRNNETWRGIPMLVVTGMRISEQRRRWLRDVTVLTKPFEFDALLAAVRRAMIREVATVRSTTPSGEC